MTDPEIKPGEPRPSVPHFVVHKDGTRQYRFAAPRPIPPHAPLPKRPKRARVVWSYTWPWLLLVGVVAVMVVLR